MTFAAGMAVEGVKPFCAIYSTFMQRAIDQMIHDVCLQQLPVRFILDRAGMVGNDGATHHGTYDLAYMGCIPDIVLMAPADEFELQNMVETQYHIDRWPSCTRFPRGNGYGKEVLEEMYSELPEGSGKNVGEYKNGQLPHRGENLPIGKGRIVRNYRGDRADLLSPTIKVAILSIGTRLLDSLRAARKLEESYSDVGVMVADARFMKPLDEGLIRSLCADNDVLLTIEEGSKGGFGAHVLQYITEEGILDSGSLRYRSMYIPDIWIEHGTQKEQYDIAGLNEPHIIAKLEGVLESLRANSFSNPLQPSHLSSLNETSPRVVALDHIVL